MQILLQFSFSTIKTEIGKGRNLLINKKQKQKKKYIEAKHTSVKLYTTTKTKDNSAPLPLF